MGDKPRAWVFTLNNPEQHGIVDNELPLHSKEKYIVWQFEVGANGTPHLQGYIELTAPCRLAAMKEWLPSAHFAMREGTRDQAREYCMKQDETYRAGPWERGVFGRGEHACMHACSVFACIHNNTHNI